ncbi:hypothetical protein TWF751_007360 [Orbilia oligospora]|nr:hypothetical protein TWF751_007360 [Orbilia oligospora]
MKVSPTRSVIVGAVVGARENALWSVRFSAKYRGRFDGSLVGIEPVVPLMRPTIGGAVPLMPAEYEEDEEDEDTAVPLTPAWRIVVMADASHTRYRGRTRGTVPVSQPMATPRYLPVQRGDGRSMEWLYHHGGYYNFVHENHDPELVRGDRRLTRRIVFSAGTRPPVTGVEMPFPGGVRRVERFIFDGPQGQGGVYRGFETLYFLDER